MGSLFSTPDTPKPITVTPASVLAADKAEKAAKAQIESEKRRKGRQSTILTGGLGVTDDTPVKKATVLGTA